MSFTSKKIIQLTPARPGMFVVYALSPGWESERPENSCQVTKTLHDKENLEDDIELVHFYETVQVYVLAEVLDLTNPEGGTKCQIFPMVNDGHGELAICTSEDWDDEFYCVREIL